MDAKLASRRLDASIYLLHDGERPSRPSGMAFGGLQCWAIPRRLSDMTSLNARLTYIGGPTALLEWEGLRLLTDPTFDPAGTGYTPPTYTLRKLIDPAAGIYLSGDTVWYEGVQEVSSRFSIRMAGMLRGGARGGAV